MRPLRTLSLILIIFLLFGILSTEAFAGRHYHDGSSSSGGTTTTTLSDREVRNLAKAYLADFQAIDPNIRYRDLIHYIYNLKAASYSEAEAGLQDYLASLQQTTTINQPPTISGMPATSVSVGSGYSFTPVATDADGDTLTFSISNRPAWASFNAATGALSGTPGTGDAGVYDNIAIRVSDGSDSASLAPFSITVDNPVQLGGSLGFSASTASVTEGDVVDVTVTRTNSAGTASVMYGTHGITAVSSTLNGDDYTGFDPIMLNFADGETSKVVSVQTLDNTVAESSETFEIYLTSPSTGYNLTTSSVATVTILDNDEVQNQQPTISGNPETSVTVGSSYRFTPSAADPDGDSLSFSVANLPSWLSFNTATGTLSGTPGLDAVGSYNDLVISVTDGYLTASLQAFSIVVSENNHIPIAVADSITIDQNSSANIDVLANDSGLEDGLTSVTVVSNATHGNLQINSDNTIRYMPDTDFYGSDVFTYQITDTNGDSDSAMTSITINCVVNCVANALDNANTLYVRAGATGNGNGSDWSNAFTRLPDTMERGVTYLVADGNYSNHDFSDAVSGTDKIYIRKATVHDHGTDTGWVDSYGDGQAVFGILNFTTGYYVFDGVTDYGFKALGGYKGAVVDIHANHTQILHTDIDGNFQLTSGYQSNGACTGLTITGTDVTVQSSDIHNIADDGVTLYNVDSVNIIESKIHHLHACGTYNGCGPCYNGHSDGFEINNTANLTITGNMVYDVKSTSAFFSGNLGQTHSSNLTLTNNIFYTPQTGLTAYLQYIQGANVYNNVIWGVLQGSRYGGLSIGPEVTGLDLKNNIILNMNFSHTGGVYNPAEHDIDYNLYGALNTSEYNRNTHEIIADPQFSNIPLSSDINQHVLDGVVVEDFMLGRNSPAIDRGLDLTGLVDSDLLGNQRPQDGDGDGAPEWDMGPLEISQ